MQGSVNPSDKVMKLVVLNSVIFSVRFVLLKSIALLICFLVSCFS